MALEKEYINVPFVGGLDEDKDPHAIEAPFLRSSTNFETDREGALRIRRRFEPTDFGPDGISHIFRYKDGAFVVGEREFGGVDTKTGKYGKLGELSSGFASEVRGGNTTAFGGYNTRVSKIRVDEKDFVVEAHNSLQDGKTYLHINVCSPDSDVSVFEHTIEDQYLMDSCVLPHAAVFMTRRESFAAPWAATLDNVMFHAIRHDGIAYSVTSIGIDEAVIAAASTSTTLKMVRQGQCSRVPGSDRVDYVINRLPRDSRLTTGDLAWGETMVGAVVVPPSGALTSLHITEVSDGTLAETDKDGSAMVAIGHTSLGVTVVATCSRMDGAVYSWTWDHSTLTAGASNFVYDAIRGYGPMWISDTPRITQFVLGGTVTLFDRRFWTPTLNPSASHLSPMVSPATAFGESMFISEQVLTAGSSVMYGTIQAVAGGGVTLAFSGVAHVGSNALEFSPLANVYARDCSRLCGSVFCNLAESSAPISQPAEAHDIILLGHLEDVGTRSIFGCAVASKWYGEVSLLRLQFPPMPNISHSGFLALREQYPVSAFYMDEEKPSQSSLSSMRQQYHCGCVVSYDRDTSELETVSLFGQDEVVPHTSPVHRWNMEEHNAYVSMSAIYDVENHLFFDMHTSRAVVADGKYVIGGTVWSGTDIENLYDGPRSIKATNLTPSGARHVFFDWEDAGRRFGVPREFSPCHVVLRPPSVSSEATPEHVIISNGNAVVFDGRNAFPWFWYIPPQPVISRVRYEFDLDESFFGDAELVGRMRVAACWYYIDSNGTKWRSAPSFVEDREIYVRTPPEDPAYGITMMTTFARPIPQPRHMTGRFGIEYYTTHGKEDDRDDEGNPSYEGDLTLWAMADAYKLPVGPIGIDIDPFDVSPELSNAYRIMGLSIGWNPMSFVKDKSILLYTNGGVLEDEPPVGGNGFTFASNRLWYVRDGRAYFSKTVSKNKPIGFNGALYVDAPNGEDLVAVASLDENVVVFSRTGVFVCVGSGPNDLGSGPSYQATPVASPVGCYNPRSVVSTQYGVFFAGPDTLYLLRRDMNVMRIGNVRDSIEVDRILDVTHDRTNQRVMWLLSGDDATETKLVVFEAERGTWHVWIGPGDIRNLTSICWTVDGVYAIRAKGRISKLTDLPHSSASLRTGWIHLGQTLGYKRFRNGLLSIRSTGEAVALVRHHYDYEDAWEQIETLGIDATPGPQLKRWKPARQKCASYAMTIGVVANTDVDVSLTHVGLEVGTKNLGHKIARGT